MKKLKLLASLIFTFIMAGKKANPRNGYKILTRIDKLKLQNFHKEKVKNVLINKGVQEFTIDGISVMARDEVNAIRKVNKLKIKQ